MRERIRRFILNRHLAKAAEQMYPGLNPNWYIRSSKNPDSFSTPDHLVERLPRQEKADIFRVNLVKQEMSKILSDEKDKLRSFSFELSSGMPFILKRDVFVTHIAVNFLGSSYEPCTLLEVIRILGQNKLSVNDFLEKFPREWVHLTQSDPKSHDDKYKSWLDSVSADLKKARKAVIAIQKTKPSRDDLEKLPQIIADDYKQVAKAICDPENFRIGQTKPDWGEAEKFAKAAGATLQDLIK